MIYFRLPWWLRVKQETMQETRARSLGWEDPLEKEMATYSSILAWRMPWTEEPGRLHGVTKSSTWLSNWHTTCLELCKAHSKCSDPVQCTCLGAVCVLALSRVCLFVTPWTVACQAPLSMGFSRQEYWSGLPFPPPDDVPDSGIEPTSPVSPALAGGFFTTVTLGKPLNAIWLLLK